MEFRKEPKIYVIHENREWIAPLEKALNNVGLPWEEWYVDTIHLPLDKTPPEGVFYNRMSASAHTREHVSALDAALPLLHWLETHSRIVVNPYNALRFEVSKAQQYIALNRFGIKTPRSVIANSKQEVLNAAQYFDGVPFIVKPNRGGKGTGVKLFDSIGALKDWINSSDYSVSPDGVSIVQQYVKPADGAIRRMEFIGGKFQYVVKVDASDGFELCPADACDAEGKFCPVDSNNGEAGKNKFSIIENYHDHNIPYYEAFLSDLKLDIAAIEYVENADGERFVYDINTNTNYNGEAEQKFSEGKEGMVCIAQYLGHLLEKNYAGLSAISKG